MDPGYGTTVVQDSQLILRTQTAETLSEFSPVVCDIDTKTLALTCANGPNTVFQRCYPEKGGNYFIALISPGGPVPAGSNCETITAAVDFQT